MSASHDRDTIAAKMRASIAALAVSLLSVAALSACGGDGSTPASHSPAIEAGAPSTEVGDGGTSGEAAGGSASAGTPADGGSAGAPDEGGQAGASDAPLIEGSLSDALAVARDGGELDLDGDGAIDISVVLAADGETTTTIFDGDHVLLLVKRRDGTAHKQGDFDLDGTMDFVEDESESASGELSRTTEQDTDFDGEPDYRASFEIDAAGVMSTVSSELVDGAWVTRESTDDSGSMYAGAGQATCTSVFPDPNLPRTLTKDVSLVGNVSIIACRSSAKGCGGAQATCSPAQVAQIQQAFEWLFQDAIDSALAEIDVRDSLVTKCLQRRQPAFLEALIHHLSVGRVRIACGISCTDGENATAGDTDAHDRSQVNLNPDQSAEELRDTILHELIHSAGFPGAIDHGTARSDAIYACAAWCSGKRKYERCDGTQTDAGDPEGQLDTSDCFRCSGTDQAKKDCCAPGQYVCTNSCCDAPCAANGRCVSDPCDPRQNGGDFSKCRYTGTGHSTNIGFDSTATVTWTYDHVVGDDVYLVPSGGITGTSALAGCTVAPLSYTIMSLDGDLRLSYGTTPPEYGGGGISQWPVTLTCGGMAAGSAAFTAGWFWPERDRSIPFTPGEHLADTRTVDDQTSTWDFAPTWKCK